MECAKPEDEVQIAQSDILACINSDEDVESYNYRTSILRTVAVTKSTEGRAYKGRLARGAIRRNECWVPGFPSVRE